MPLCLGYAIIAPEGREHMLIDLTCPAEVFEAVLPTEDSPAVSLALYNLSDGVIAPLFWLALLGTPGMMAYKMVNTLDSMIGYRTERYRLFGCVAARIDDAANWLPARLTALLMVLASGRLSLLAFVSRYGRCHASPNSGYPEAALAGILDCRFGGTHTYFGEEMQKPYIGSHDRPLTTADMQRAVRINRTAEVLMLLITAAIIFLIE